MTDTEWNFDGLRALFINCTLKPSPEISNTQALVDAFSAHGGFGGRSAQPACVRAFFLRLASLRLRFTLGFS